jgi:SAM-dependent methyltransferase
MASRGFDMIGIDLSSDMLCRAKEKTMEAGLDILYLNQDMAEFELYGTVDAIVCLMDSINYITETDDLRDLFKLVKNYLNPGGLFIFDINSKYKFEEVLNDSVFYSVEDDISYIWENRYDSETGLCEFDLTFFTKEGNAYKRWDELHVERAYSVEELKEMLEESGLLLLKTYQNLELVQQDDRSERIFFVCKSKDIEVCE